MGVYECNVFYKYLQLECCGVVFLNDLCDMIFGIMYCVNILFYICCYCSLYDIIESNIYSNSVCSNLNIVRCWYFIIFIVLNIN